MHVFGREGVLDGIVVTCDTEQMSVPHYSKLVSAEANWLLEVDSTGSIQMGAISVIQELLF